MKYPKYLISLKVFSNILLNVVMSEIVEEYLI